MKANDMLNKIKTIIGGIELTEEVKEIQLAEMKLQNGTVVEAEEFKKGEAIFIKSDDERIAMPVGEYVLEDGKLLVVEEEGIIADMRDVSDDVPAKEEASEELAEEADVADWEGMEKRIKNLEDAVADLKADKVEASKEEITEEVKEEIKEDVEVELSADVAEPVKHNPEASNESKFTLKKNNYPQSLQSRIYAKLNN